MAVPAQTLVQLLSQQAASQSDAPIYITLDDAGVPADTLSYGELWRRALEVASQLSAISAPGARVGLIAPPGSNFVVGFFGALMAGLVVVPAYPPDRPRMEAGLTRIGRILTDCRAEMVLCVSQQASLRYVAHDAGLQLGALPWICVDQPAMVPGPAPGIAPVSTDIALLQYTSGSTGDPKGVILTHRNLLSNQASIREAMNTPDKARFVTWLPPYHDMGLIGTLLQPLYVGGSCVILSPQQFVQTPVRWLRAISRYRGQVSGGPNFAYRLCVDRISDAERRDIDLSSWEVAFVGAEPVRLKTLKAFADAFSDSGFSEAALFPCYGLAEASLLVTGAQPQTGPEFRWFDSDQLERGVAASAEPNAPRSVKLVSSGRPPSNLSIRICDAAGRTLDDRRVGEVWVNGDSITSGYWKRPDTNRETIVAAIDGSYPWLRTGDLGFCIGDQLYLVGRLKELVIIRGRNLAPQDLEETVQALDPRLRGGCGAAFSTEIDGQDRLIILQELSRSRRTDPDELARRAAAQVAAVHGVSVFELLLLDPKSIRKTRNGKLERVAAKRIYEAGGFQGIGTSKSRVLA